LQTERNRSKALEKTIKQFKDMMLNETKKDKTTGGNEEKLKKRIRKPEETLQKMCTKILEYGIEVKHKIHVFIVSILFCVGIEL
jgi:hypothetical protein